MADRKGKRFKTVVDATYAATNKLKIQQPQDEVFRRQPNIAGYGTKLNKTTGDPGRYYDELPTPKDSVDASKNPYRFTSTTKPAAKRKRSTFT